MKALDLFSCIGCHAIGFERAGIETIAFCEKNEWRRNRISNRFPKAPVYEDVRSFHWVFEPYDSIDIVIGGPPCQATSVAAAIHGKRTGKSLWPEMLRIGLEANAEWFVVEQPPGNADWEAKVTDDLSRAGYHVARFEFGANDIGAPYLRRRVFLVACTSLPRLEVTGQALPSQIDSVKRAANARGDWEPGKLAFVPVDDRTSGERESAGLKRWRKQWIEAVGDSNPPHMAEVIGRAIMASLPPQELGHE
jgi:DNA (cytosine-5)-methyltransferase 1